MDVRDSPLFPITFSSPGLRFQVQVQSKVIDRSGVRFVIVSSDRSSCTDDGLLYIRAAATFSDFEHLCLYILFQVSL